jgi:hypothetical protein
MYGLMTSAREFSLDNPEEDMVALDLRLKFGRNRSKQKLDEEKIHGPRGIRGII